MGAEGGPRWLTGRGRPLLQVVARATEQPAAAKFVAAAGLAAALTFGAVQPAQADISGLKPCKSNKAYKKREKKALKALKKRMSQYEEGSAPALAIEATMDRTEKRFAMYAKQGLLCGSDGYPHLIAEPALAVYQGHAGDIFIPTWAFLYIAGYIGFVGRKYLQYQKETNAKNPQEGEIIIDVPYASKLAMSNWLWPVAAIREWQDGELFAEDDEITVSPR